MPTLHPVSRFAAAVWGTAVALAVLASGLSASAGRLPDRWTGVGMAFGFAHVALVVAGMWHLPPTLPRIVVRLGQIFAMALALWSAGTLTRALYALLG